MTEPDDATQPVQTPQPAVPGGPLGEPAAPPFGGPVAPPPPPSAAPPPPPAAAPPPPPSAAPPPPPSAAPPPPPAAAPGSQPPAPDAPTAPPLRADPNRPADSGWREPPWIPARRRDPRPNLVSLVVGFALIAFGLWFFLDHTLGIALPRIEWRSIWPVILIVIGGAILLRSLDRSR